MAEQQVGMCQMAHEIVIGDEQGFQDQVHDVSGAVIQLFPPVQQLKGWNYP